MNGIDQEIISQTLATDLMHNPCRVVVTLMPYPNLVEEGDRAQAARLSRYALRITPTEPQALPGSSRKPDLSLPVSATVAIPRLTRALTCKIGNCQPHSLGNSRLAECMAARLDHPNPGSWPPCDQCV